MTGHMIQRMLEYLPAEPSERSGNSVSFRQSELERFAKHYGNVAFGHYFVRRLLETRTKFPTWLDTEDHYWLHRLYRYELGDPDEVIQSVLMLRMAAMERVRRLIEAMIVSPEATPERISRYTGWPETVISAYEKIFFNMWDRKRDHIYVATVVYPESRLKESDEDYRDISSPDELLMRVGYNTNLEYLAYMAGMPSSLVSELSSDSATQKLEAVIMANGFVMAKTGYLNDPKCHALRHAKTIMAAAKHGGEGSQESDPFASAGQSLLGEIRRYKSAEARQAIEFQKEIHDDCQPALVVNDKSIV